MSRKKLLFAGLLCVVAAVGVGMAILLNDTDKGKKELAEEHPVQQQPAEPKPEIAVMTEPQESKTPVVTPQKTQLKDLEKYQDLPLSAVVELSELPENIRKIINKQIDESAVYYIGAGNNKVVLIKEANTDSERFSRHDFDILNISISDGNITCESASPQKMSNDESEREIWQYEVVEGDMMVPSYHKSLNEDGTVKSVENWYYSPDDDVKYKVTDEKGNVISIRKTSSSADGNWRDEHIFYDKNGNTTLNLSTIYENNHIARFTYYNAKNPENGVIIINEYQDGNKTKESIYSSDYKLKNTYEAEYKDGSIVDIKVLDSANQKVDEVFLEE